MLKTVRTEYSGCYWNPSQRKCRMNQRDDPVEDSDNAVTTLEACETMYTEVEEDDTVIDDGEEGVEENGVVENEEEEETPLSNIAFDDQNHNEIRAALLVRKSRDLASKFILRAAQGGT